MKNTILIMMLSIGSLSYSQEPKIKLCGVEHEYPKGKRTKEEWIPTSNPQLEKLLVAKKLFDHRIINQKGFDSIRLKLR